MATQKQFLTVKQVAERYGVHPNKVFAWIGAGDLAAVDVSEARSHRPRWRVDLEAVERFESERRSVPTPKPVRQTKRRQMAGVIEFVK